MALTGPGAVYPTSIKDPNGNYITITYVNNSGPRIQTIVDTLNRIINFHYDANNFLTAITGPGLNNSTRTLVRLQLPADLTQLFLQRIDPCSSRSLALGC